MRWPHVPIGELASFRGGGTPSKSNPAFYGGSVPWVTPKDMKRWRIDDSQIRLTEAGVRAGAAKIVPAGAVLVVVRSGVLKHSLPVAIAAKPVTVNQDIKALVCSDRIEPRYLARLIAANERRVLGWVRATTADNFPVEKLKTLPIPLPPVEEQRRIADVLDRADALRAKRREALALLDDLTQSIFLDMFGDPNVARTDLPVVTVNDLLESATYGTAAKAGSEGRYPILRMGNLTVDGKIDMTDLKYIDLDAKDEAKYLVKSGDILFNRTNSAGLVGKTAVYTGKSPLAYAGYLVRLRVTPNNHPEYLSAFLNSAYGKRVLRGMAKSIIGMANINAKEVQRIKIGLPPPAAQTEFADRLHAVEHTRTELSAAALGLDQLLSSLQQRAFRGEL